VQTWVLVSYIKQKRSQLILVCFLLASVLLAQFPGIDLQISRGFFDDGFLLRDPRWQVWFRDGTTCFLYLSMAFVTGVYVLNKLSKRNWCGVDGKKVGYLFLVLVLGAGLIVNVVLKDNFGRARPRDIEEFGGSKHFTPAFVVSRECAANCSFSSGEGAGAFFSLALAMALSRKRALFTAGVALGCLVSFSRVASGAHFFSDTVVSFFVMLIVADVLYHYMLVPQPELEEIPVPASLAGNAAWEPD
jgi:lipid A 4'-phosphatase